MVLQPSSPLPRPLDSLLGAVETHAAIRDGNPHSASMPLGLTALSTAEATKPNGSRRAPRRKATK